MNAHGISGYNTRLFKSEGPGGAARYRLRLASAATPVDGGAPRTFQSADPVTDGWESITVEHGDHAPLMERVCAHLTKAVEYVAASCVRGGVGVEGGRGRCMIVCVSRVYICVCIWARAAYCACASVYSTLFGPVAPPSPPLPLSPCLPVLIFCWFQVRRQ